MRSHRIASALLLAVAGTAPLMAGTYSQVLDRIRENVPTIPGNFQPVAIVHPPGYVQIGGAVVVPVCVRPGSQALEPSVSWSIEIWNALTPRYGNCRGCLTIEEVLGGTPQPGTLVDLPGTILHELGHCAMGLGHSNMDEIVGEEPRTYRTGTCDLVSDGCCGDPTSFSASMNAEEVLDSNGVRGDRTDEHRNACLFLPAALGQATEQSSKIPGASSGPPQDLCTWEAPFEDCQTPPPPHQCLVACCPEPPDCCPQCPGPQCPTVEMQVQNVSWYRRADNDPFKIDDPPTPIDRNTFTRSLTFLPAGSSFAANANRVVGEQMGYQKNQNLMYSQAAVGSKVLGLNADDVNMVKMGMTGEDRLVGGGDDYTLQLQLVPDCAQATVEVYFDATVAELAVCRSWLEIAFPQPGVVIHYRKVHAPALTKLEIGVSPTEPWDYSIVVFFAGFETGTTLEWSSTSP